MRVMKHLLWGILLVLLVVAIAAYIGTAKIHGLADQPLLNKHSEFYELKPGTSFKLLAEQLHQRGIIDQPLLFRLYAREQQLAHRIQAGEYQIPPEISHADLLQMLVAGRVRAYQITLVEGQTVTELLQVIQAHPQIKATLDPQSDAAAIGKALGLKGSAEGWILPETYQVTRGTQDIDLLKRAHQQMQQVLKQVWEQRADKLPLKTPYEALILASIVEKETGAAFERPQIAGVFTRRLVKGMRLQTDPTVIYGMGEHYQGNITRADLNRKTPYNTYRINGLPPTPIANPGQAAIEAALNPKPGKALYFVAKGDGTHQFSDTLAQHNQAVYRYQRSQRRKDYRSAPPASQTASSSNSES